MGMDRIILKFRLRLLSWLYRSRSGPIAFVEQFSYKDIKKATNGFNRIVYSNAQVVAYKAEFRGRGVALVKEIKEFRDSDDVFFKEVQLLGRLHHRHILSLRGFSIGRKRFLVSDGVQNGSLKEHLNDPLRTPLNWTTRLQIAIGVAAALEYLFIFSDPPVYHVSISTRSIMLDDAFAAKLSDVGLLSSTRNHASLPNSPISEDNVEQECQNIIFQLGLLILELVTGQSSEKGTVDLVKWIQGSKVASSMQKMIDPDLGSDYNVKEARILLAVAKLCVESRKKPRFSISQLSRRRGKNIYSVLQPRFDFAEEVAAEALPCLTFDRYDPIFQAFLEQEALDTDHLFIFGHALITRVLRLKMEKKDDTFAPPTSKKTLRIAHPINASNLERIEQDQRESYKTGFILKLNYLDIL